MSGPSEEILDLLTAYALDVLDPKEVVQVVELLKAHPELRETLAEMRMAVQHLPLALPHAEPTADLRQRTLDYAVGRTSRKPQGNAPNPVVRLRRWMFALSSVLAVAVVVAIGGWLQYARTNAELLRVQNDFMALQSNQQQAVATLAQSNALIALNGSGGQGALLRTAAGATVLAAHLPPLQSNRVYQLWFIQGQGAPVSAGLFAVDNRGDGFVVLQPGQQLTADTFAVTDEPVGGSPGPTTPILVAGKAPPA